MTQQEITSANIEIAKMLGYVYITWQQAKEEKYGKHIKPGWWTGIPKKIHPMIPVNQYYIGRSNIGLNFDSDWNYLMKAVDFILNFTVFELNEDFFRLKVKIQTLPLSSTKIEIFKIVAEFAKLHNQKK